MRNVTDNWRVILGRLAAEFAVVVLGVTIALWADGWVAKRADHAEEIARLNALQDNVTHTLTDLRSARDHAKGAAGALRELVSPQLRDRGIDEAKDLLRYGFLYGSDFYPELNVYDDLKNSGELALLTNPVLRQSLATMDVRLELVRLAQADLTTVQQLNIDSYMIDHMSLRSFYGTLTGLDDIPEDLDADIEFTADIKFQNLVLLKLDIVTHLQIVLENAEDTLIIVQQTIASQLAN